AVRADRNRSPWEELGCRRTGAMSLQRITQELPDRSALLTQGLHDGQDSLHEAATALADTAECLLAPKHSIAESAFGSVVGRFNSLLPHERPQGRLQHQELTAQGDGLGAARGAA